MSRVCNRIYYVRDTDIDAESWNDVCRGASSLGFDCVLTPDPDPSQPIVACACKRYGLHLMVDLALDPREAHLPGLQGGPDPAGRMPPGLIDAWSERLIQYVLAGVSGFRCRDPATLHRDDWRILIERARSHDPACQFMAWTPGVPMDRLIHLMGVGFDTTFSSLPWWDDRATWLVDEQARLQGMAPVYAPIADPDCVLVDMGSDDQTVARAHLLRRILTAIVTGQGVLLPDVLAHQVDPSVLTAMNAWFAQRSHTAARLQALTGILSTVTVLYRGGVGVVINPGAEASAIADWVVLRARMPQGLTYLSAVQNIDGSAVTPLTDRSTIAPGAAILFVASAPSAVNVPMLVKGTRRASVPISPALRIAIENVTPSVDHGRFQVKCVAGDPVEVQADVLMDGHDQLAVQILWRAADETDWHEHPMSLLGNDRWHAAFHPTRIGKHYYTIRAWRDTWGTYRDQLEKKLEAGQDLSLDIEEGCTLLAAACERVRDDDSDLAASLERMAQHAEVHAVLSPVTADAMRKADQHEYEAKHCITYPLMVERREAVYGSWYELFPRSCGPTSDVHGRFTDVMARLPAIRDMGFDVLYFPPIHPIGLTHRKGKNNALNAGPDDPGSPYAIGSAQGGHTAVHPELGTLEDFQALLMCARSHDLEIALDFAVQCSPDHPWLVQHPEWFDWRADGSLRYAENPPKRYEDIVNPDFYNVTASASRRTALWGALRDIVVFWIGQGVRIFRVDNPHTKPLPFWEWLIAGVKGEYPDVLFLSEAFTHPKMMYRLAKLGFSQSYTYFTWRHGKQELTAYLTELNTPPVSDFFRPNFFVNTPDINPYFLQKSGRPGFLIRAALAATTSGLWGVYSGFELCEARSVLGKEEYLDSEKYELRAWDWDRPVNIIAEITKLNQIRRTNPALQTHLGIHFHSVDDEHILFFSKSTPQHDNVVLVAVSLDPYTTRTGTLELPLWEWGLPDDADLELEELFDDHRFSWSGKYHRVELSPQRPFLLWRMAHPL